MAAIALFDKGLNNSEIGRRLKVCNQTVSRWRKRFEKGGRQNLQQAGRAGRKALMSDADRQRLLELLQQGPERLGYETPLWTCERVAYLMRQEFDISYHVGHVWKVLRQLNWSPQRPVGRALERNEACIQQWKTERWPVIKKKPRRKAARLSSLMKAD